jgi:predicted nucleic acid-binding protein
VIQMAKINERQIVVDANVLGHTSHGAIDRQTWKATLILCKIEESHKIVLDIQRGDEECIFDEYRRQAKSELAKWWLIAMQTRRGKIIYKYRALLHFTILPDPDDEKYLQVAVQSTDKIVISEDSDLTEISNHPEITSRGISIWDFDLAITLL